MKLNLNKDMVDYLEQYFLTAPKECLSNGKFISEIGFIEDMDIDALWGYFGIRDDFLTLPYARLTFELRREAFLWLVKRLIEDSYIQLINKTTNLPIGISIDKAIDVFREAFPSNDEDMENGLWFFYDDCPYGCRWSFDGRRTPYIQL